VVGLTSLTTSLCSCHCQTQTALRVWNH